MKRKTMVFISLAFGFAIGYYVSSRRLRKEKRKLVRAYRNEILKIPRYFYLDSRTIEGDRTGFFENPYN